MDKLVLGNITVHVFASQYGQLFSLHELATKIFDQTPGSILQEIRVARYIKYQMGEEEMVDLVTAAGIPLEGSAAHPSTTLLPPTTFLALLTDKRKAELIQPLQLALLKFSSQEAARLMSGGNYEGALPVTLDAIKQAQDLFHNRPVIQMFPLYLLAAQANLGLKRLKQAEDFLSLATHLSVQHQEETSHVMMSQLNRLYGQLYVLKSMPQEALQSFAEDLYHCSVEYGPEDVRSALGYYNLAKMFQSLGDAGKCGPCCEQTVDIWLRTMDAVMLGEGRISDLSRAKDLVEGQLPLSHSQLPEVISVMEDLRSMIGGLEGPVSDRVVDVLATSAALLIHAGRRQDAIERLDECHSRLDGLQELGWVGAEKALERVEKLKTRALMLQ